MSNLRNCKLLRRTKEKNYSPHRKVSNNKESFVQHEPTLSSTSTNIQPLSSPPPAPLIAPSTQTSSPPGLDDHWFSHSQNPTPIVEDASVESNLDFGEIVSVCEHTGFKMKISIDASEKIINYDFLPKGQSSPSEEAQLRKGFNSNFSSTEFSFYTF